MKLPELSTQKSVYSGPVVMTESNKFTFVFMLLDQNIALHNTQFSGQFEDEKVSVDDLMFDVVGSIYPLCVFSAYFMDK